MNVESPELIDTGKGYTVKYKGKLLYSSVDPKAPVLKKIEGAGNGEKTLFLIPSIGIGYGIRELLDRLPEESHVLCVEAEPELFDFALSQTINPLPADSRFTLLSSSGPESAVRVLREMGVWRFRRVSVLMLTASSSLHSETYNTIARLLEAEIQTFWKNKMTLIQLCPLWIRNAFYNLPLIPGSFSFSNLRTGMPVLVAGAGPSLEESIAWIKRSRKRILVLACDTAFPILMKHSIRPDLIFMLESQIANLYDFVSSRDPSIPVICDLTSSPQVLRTLGSRICFFASEFHPNALYERLCASRLLPVRIPPLGSVGVAALHASLRITTGSVYVTGLDFAYTGGKTHANGSPFHELAEISSSRLAPISHIVYSAVKTRPLIRLKDKNGYIVESDPVLSSYARLISAAIEDSKERVFDIGGSGLGLSLNRIKADATGPDLAEPASSAGMESCGAGEQGGDALAFLETELGLLQRARDKAERLLHSREAGTGEMDADTSEIFRSVDYAYLHFPEPDPRPAINQSYLTRLLISILHYIEICERAIRYCGY